MTAPATMTDPRLELLEQRLRKRFFSPKPKMTTAEWASKFRVLTTESSALAGKFRPLPYQVEPMEALDNDEVKSVVCALPSQIGGKTEIGLNWFGRQAHLNPGPMLAVEPTLGMAKTLSEDRVDPMFAASPVLREMLAVSGSKGKGNRQRYKRGAGWALTMIGARSAAELSMRPIRDRWMDEIDRYPRNVGDEGSVAEIVDARGRSYEEMGGKRLITGTPVFEDLANSIWVYHQQSSGGEWKVPCPFCNFVQPLTFGGVDEPFGLKWDTNDLAAPVQYLCAACAALIPERFKGAMNAAGAYVHERPDNRTHRSFHFEGVASEMVSWEYGRNLFLATRGLPDKLQTFQNTYRALPWRSVGDQPDKNQLLLRRLEPMDGCPDWSIVLTIGIDVQDSRVEVMVAAWGPGEQCWVRIGRIEGDTSTIRSQVWKDLDQVIARVEARQGGGQLRARMIAIDLGHRAEVVSEWVRRRKHLNVRGVRGVEGDTMVEPVNRARKANKYGIEYWRVSNHLTKRALFRRLARISSPGPGYICFDASMTDEMIEQFTAEKATRVGGRMIYQKVANRRNEAIDLWNYCYAALWMAGPAVRNKLDRAVMPVPGEASAETPAPAPPPPPAKPRKTRARRRGWVNG